MRFDFAGRFQSAFGFVSPQVSRRLKKDGFAEVVQEPTTVSELSVFVWSDDSVFDEVTLYRDVAGQIEKFRFAAASLDESEFNSVFALPPMLSLSRSKKLVITDNNEHEVIERYSTKPYEITWRGLMIDLENHEFPLDKLELLNNIFEVNSVWNVASEILQAVKVEAVIIQDIDIEFIEGYEDTIAYTLKLRASKPLEYQLLNQ